MHKAILLTLPVVIAATGCSREPAARDRQEPGDADTAAAVSTSLPTDNTFGWSIFRTVNGAGPEKNVFISPVSVSMALGMALNGATGATRDSITATLGLSGMTPGQIGASYRAVLDMPTDASQVELAIANSIWLRNDFKVLQEFIDVNGKYYDAETATLDFKDPKAAEEINDWVEEKTGGKIPTIVEPPIDDDVVMYLINAVYFKGSWSEKFDPKQTTDAPFTRLDGSTIPSRLMYREGRMRYVETPTEQAVDLLYADSAYGMTVILPKQGTDVNALIAGLTPERWTSIVDGMKEQQGEIFLPRFTMNYEITLNDALSALGMGIAFTDRAEFNGIRPEGGLMISRVLHKSFLEVNEEGTEAAAATSTEIKTTAMPLGFVVRCDRPFVVVIRRRTGNVYLPLFTGKIVSPEASTK